MTFILGMIAGGAIIYLCPGLGTAGSAIWSRLRAWWGEVGK